MIKIYKYPLFVNESQVIKLQRRHRVLSVGLQDNQIYLWSAVETDDALVDLEVYIYGTGHTVTGSPTTKNIQDLKFIGTVQQGPFVWHVLSECLVGLPLLTVN